MTAQRVLRLSVASGALPPRGNAPLLQPMGMLQGDLRITQRAENRFYFRRHSIIGRRRLAEGRKGREICSSTSPVRSPASPSYTTDWEEVDALSLVILIGLCYSNLVNEPRFPTPLLFVACRHLRRVYKLVSDLQNNRSKTTHPLLKGRVLHRRSVFSIHLEYGEFQMPVAETDSRTPPIGATPASPSRLNHLRLLEAESIHILREVASEIEGPSCSTPSAKTRP